MSYDTTRKTILDTSDNDGASVHDVQQALGITANELKDLCTSSQINPWARFKPIKATGVEPLAGRVNNQGYFQDGSAYGINGLYYSGIDPSTFVSTVYNVMNTPSNVHYPSGYRYLRPEGSLSSPYRLHDFAVSNSINPQLGYEHTAQYMFSFVYNGDWYSLQPFYFTTDGKNNTIESQEIAFSDEDTIIESTTSIQNTWETYSEAIVDKELREMSWNWDNKMLILDVIYAAHSSISDLKSMKHGILFIESGQTTSYAKMVIGKMPKSETLVANGFEENTPYKYVEFYTTMPGDGLVTISSSGSYNWIPIPLCFGTVSFKGTNSYVDFSAYPFPGIVNNQWDIWFTIEVKDSNNWESLKVVLASDSTATTSDYNKISGELKNYTSRSGEIHLDINASSAPSGTALYLNLIAKTSASSTYYVKESQRIELNG